MQSHFSLPSSIAIHLVPRGQRLLFRGGQPSSLPEEHMNNVQSQFAKWKSFTIVRFSTFERRKMVCVCVSACVRMCACVCRCECVFMCLFNWLTQSVCTSRRVVASVAHLNEGPTDLSPGTFTLLLPVSFLRANWFPIKPHVVSLVTRVRSPVRMVCHLITATESFGLVSTHTLQNVCCLTFLKPFILSSSGSDFLRN